MAQVGVEEVPAGAAPGPATSGSIKKLSHWHACESLYGSSLAFLLINRQIHSLSIFYGLYWCATIAVASGNGNCIWILSRAQGVCLSPFAVVVPPAEDRRQKVKRVSLPG